MITTFGHENVIGYCDRPYLNAHEMNVDMVEKWNSVVKPEDTVYYLGDFSMSTHNIHIVSKLNGNVLLLPGNHDRSFNYLDKKQSSLPQRRKLYYDAGFKKILEQPTSIKVGDYDVLLSHFPYFEDHSEFNIRYKEYRPKDNGQFLLHGHIHQNWLKKSRQINVGVDVWGFKPVSENTIIAVIKDKRDFIKNYLELDA